MFDVPSCRRAIPVRGRDARRFVAAGLAIAAIATGMGTSAAGAATGSELVPPPALRPRVTQALEPGIPLADGLRLELLARTRILQPGIATVLPNILVNNPTGELPFTGNTQTEPSIAACGDTLVCGFTDSGGFFAGGTLTGFAVSFDAGQTWFDGGCLPRLGLGGTEMVLGDATMLSDGHGHWYCLSEYDVGNGTGDPGSGDLGLVLQRATFLGTTLQWSLPWIVAGTGSGDALDSPHMAIDRDRDRLYITYTNLSIAYLTGQIEVLTIGDAGTAILHQTVVQAQVVGVNNAGASVAVGPDGEVYCAWESGLLVGSGQGPAKQMVARSLDQGATFSAPAEAGTVIESWLSGPPGFNREQYFVEFPSLAVDCSPGPRRGRVYLAWHHGVQMSFGGTLTPVSEIGGANDSPQAAQVLPASSSQWQIAGALPSNDWSDWYRFSGNAGEHVRMIVSPSSAMNLGLHLYCGAGPGGAVADTLLAGSTRSPGDYVFFLISLPRTGDYFVEVSRMYANTGSYTGYLRRTTTTTPGPAMDHRDIVVVSSPDGVSGWTPAPVRVNDDSGFTDQAFPALAVDGAGGLHVNWYDRRFDSRWHAGADFMLASSFDGGLTFTPNERLTGGSSFWQVPADMQPNFGDFYRPCAAGNRLFAVWTDGRRGDPDVMVAPLRTDFTVAVPASIRAHVGAPLGLEVAVTNDTPFDAASFTVEVHPQIEELPDTTFVIPSLARGSSESVKYEPMIGVWVRQYGHFDVDVLVSSDRSAFVDAQTVSVSSDQVDVRVMDMELQRTTSGVRLAWRSDAAAHFDVERAARAEGPFVRLTATPLGAVGGDRFAYDDALAPAGEGCAYRLVGHDRDGSQEIAGPWMLGAAGGVAPARVALFGAEPNPFNPSTVLRFELPHPARVSLRILDVRGRVVAELLHGASYPAGQHAVRWDVQRAGVQASSGVYVAELEALGKRVSRRLVLLR